MGQFRRKRHLRGIGQFRQHPGRQRLVAVQLRLVHGEHGLGLGIVQPDQQLALLHHTAFLHQQFGDDAAFAVLHGLAVAVHRKRAGADHGPVQRRQPGPGAKPAEEGEDGQHADADCVFHARPPATIAGICFAMNSGARCTPVICPSAIVAT